MKRNPRRGTVIVVAVFLMGISALVLTAILNTYRIGRNELQREQSRLQVDWLAEAALERAAAHLARQADYTGETWTIPPAELGGTDGAVVRIRVEPVDGKPNRRIVHVEADYPDHPQYRVRELRQTTVDRRDQT